MAQRVSVFTQAASESARMPVVGLRPFSPFPDVYNPSYELLPAGKTVLAICLAIVSRSNRFRASIS
jgi:hypothetical protein